MHRCRLLNNKNISNNTLTIYHTKNISRTKVVWKSTRYKAERVVTTYIQIPQVRLRRCVYILNFNYHCVFFNQIGNENVYENCSECNVFGKRQYDFACATDVSRAYGGFEIEKLFVVNSSIWISIVYLMKYGLNTVENTKYKSFENGTGRLNADRSHSGAVVAHVHTAGTGLH